MNIFTALELIGWTCFYFLVFACACSVVTTAVKQVIKTYYEMKLLYRVSVVRQEPEREKQLIDV